MELKKLCTSSRYVKYCDSRDEPMFKGWPHRNICIAILNYLENKYSASNDNKMAYDDCKLLSYWAYSTLFAIMSNEKYVLLAYAQVQRIWNDFIKHLSENKKCEPINSMVSYTDWRKRKELYEYCVNYSVILQLANTYRESCSKFYKYVQNKAPLYEFFKNKCPDDNKNICPEFYEDCKKYNPEVVLSNFNCHRKKIDGGADMPSVLEEETPLLVGKPNSEDSSFHILGSAAKSDVVFDSNEMSFQMPTDDVSENLNEKSHTVTKVGNILLGVVTTSMASGALYKVNINSLIQINCISLLISIITST
ncbi:hypothetical protein PCYB_002530 [Plasmodium cynomolgi strain B]|uniref:CYIR protein n=1 Tax=Plasmodium cynomolgi (strain B) TaxID=1120755 RepID=K6UZU4_PLACD|nr:hypothetical protein PCYB_002530 [Plasmodium cynomolgi strain B]GAB69504.1 hypothetical protein PCYB_002530 [Plasmodium cynomolgi strain B]